MSVSREAALEPTSSRRRRRRRRIRLPSAAMEEEVLANSDLAGDATTARAGESEEVPANPDLVSDATTARARESNKVPANSDLVSDAMDAGPREKSSEEAPANSDLASDPTTARAGESKGMPENPDLAGDATTARRRRRARRHLASHSAHQGQSEMSQPGASRCGPSAGETDKTLASLDLAIDATTTCAGNSDGVPANTDLAGDATATHQRSRTRRHRARRSVQQGENEVSEPGAARFDPSAGKSDGLPASSDLAGDATATRRRSRARRHRTRRSVQQRENEESEPGTVRRSPSTREGNEAPANSDLPNPSTTARRRRRAHRPSRLGPALATSYAQGTNLHPGEFSALTWEPEAAIAYPASDIALAPLLDIPRSLLDDLETVYRHERARARFERTLRRWVLINLEVEQWEHFVACCMDTILWAIEEKRDFATAHEIMVGWRADDEMMAWKKIRYKSGVRVADLEEKANGWVAAAEAARLNICVTWFGVLREKEGPEIDIKPLLLPYIEARKTCLVR